MGDVEIWLVRHGATEWSTSGRHTGRTDVALTEAGEEAARRLGAQLAGVCFDRVLTSPLQRARETCRLAGLLDRAQVVDDLREWDYGAAEGRTTDEIRAQQPGWTVWSDGADGAETLADLGRRADRVVELLLADATGRTAVFSHGHLLRVLAARWVGLGPDCGRLLALDTAALSVLGWEREQRVIRGWNLSCPPPA